MTNAVESAQNAAMPDVQASADRRNIAIDRVGVKDVVYPLRLRTRSGGEQTTVAKINMYVSLPHYQKGTHMSRFLEVLKNVIINGHPMYFQATNPAKMLQRLKSDLLPFRCQPPELIFRAFGALIRTIPVVISHRIGSGKAQ